jgi:glycosyltransferase involved in cell wall biosynthesis
LEELTRELKVADKVEFAGQQLNVAPFMNSTQAFVMSSRSEGLPMSLLQAMSIGLPSIVTDVGGMAEVVRLAQGGFVVPVGQPEEYAKALLSMAADPQKRAEFSGSARSAFERWFTLEAMAKSYMELYSRRTT